MAGARWEPAERTRQRAADGEGGGAAGGGGRRRRRRRRRRRTVLGEGPGRNGRV